MVHILFVSGSFGSSIFYSISQYVKENTQLKITDKNLTELFLNDGSMHSVEKMGHFMRKQELVDYLKGETDQNFLATTPIYPMMDCHADEIIDMFKKQRPNDRYIFVKIDDLNTAEFVMLAHYYKISIGDALTSHSIEHFCNDNQHNIVNWNPSYTHWSQMQIWELREWLSIFYPVWVQEWIDAKQHINPDWFTVSPMEILHSPGETFLKIINYAGTFNEDMQNEFDEFIRMWRPKQQYILDEHYIINSIVENTISKKVYKWNDLNIIAESIIQRKLRSAGYEIKCYNLNKFPTNSEDLFALLEKNEPTQP